MMTRIRNAHMKSKTRVDIIQSKINFKIAQLLLDEGYINAIKPHEDPHYFTIILKYYKNKPVIESIKRISRPGLRRYANYKNIPTVRSNLGIAIVSTSAGLMTGQEAINRHLGGELIGEIY